MQPTIVNPTASELEHTNSAEFDFSRIGIQPKLKVSQPGDLYEQEADKVAEQVTRISASDSIAHMIAAKEQGIDRECLDCEMEEEEEEEKMEISRKPSATSNLQGGDQVTNEINDIRSSSGSPLDPGTKEFLGSRFGYDFSKVRIHSNEKAARSAYSVNSLAYTVGNDIVFGEGQYKPDTLEGNRLLAHELTHVIQQTSTDRLHLDHSDDKHDRSPMAVHLMVQRDPAPKEPARTTPLAVNLSISPDHAVVFGTSTVTVGDLNIRFTGRMAVRGQGVLIDVELPKKGAAAFVKQRVREQFKSAFEGAKAAGTSSKVELGLAG